MHVPKLNAFVSTFLYAVPHLVLSINMQASVEQISDKCWQQPKFNKTKKQISHQIFTNIISWQWFANRPLAYLRYVDDTFAVFNNGDDCNTFLSQLNSLHPSLRFTHEKEFNHSLPFLDVLVVLRSDIPSGICAKLRTVGASNNRVHMTWSLSSHASHQVQSFTS